MTRFVILAWFIASSTFQIFAKSRPELPNRILQDTTIQGDTLSITPYYGKTQTKALGNFAFVAADKIAFQTYAGFNVLNTLRGHVPNFSISPNTSALSPGLRSAESMMVIDGLPLNSSIANYYNLNSFEYQNIYTISSGNAMALYGGTGSNGGFFLQSKTGENFTRPTFEFNSSPTLIWTESQPSLLGGESETNTQSVFTNAIAYKQDFGAVDTRVSYTYSLLPDGNNDADTRSDYHNVRVNTGINITSRFNARLILDSFYAKDKSSQSVTLQGPPIMLNSETVRKNLQGNLQLQYKPLDWLSFSSQSSLSKIDNNVESYYQTLYSIDRKQNRTFANLYTSVNRSLLTSLSFTAFLGYQYEKLKQEQQMQSSLTLSQSKSENKTTSILGGVGLQFKNYLFTDFNYRQDYFSVYGSDNNTAPTYSINASFIFSDAFNIENSWFSFGKVRASYGKNSVAIRQGYPDEWSGTQTNAYPNPDLHASAKQMFESGIDLNFLQSRITLNTSYFSDYHDQMASRLPVPTGATGVGYVLANFWTLDTKGWEIILGATSFKKSNFSMETKLIWSAYKTKLESSTNLNLGNTSVPVIRGGVVVVSQNSGNQSQVVSLGNPYPDWTGSLLNQIKFKNFFTSFLIDVREGGVFYNVDYSSSFPTVSVEDGSIAKLRDLSIGYRLSSGMLDKLSIREAQFSVSGRNMWTIYSESDRDVEGSAGSPPQKSATLSLTLMF
jgi:hypothetical protein